VSVFKIQIFLFKRLKHIIELIFSTAPVLKYKIKIENNVLSPMGQKWKVIFDTNCNVQKAMKCTGYTDFYTINSYNCTIFLNTSEDGVLVSLFKYILDSVCSEDCIGFNLMCIFFFIPMNWYASKIIFQNSKSYG